MISVKDGVGLHGITKEIWNVVPYIERAYLVCCPDKRAVITSGRDGEHKNGSKHYSGNALDFRTNNLDLEQMTAIKAMLNKTIPNKLYDVVWEKDHLHIEYDPKA